MLHVDKLVCAPASSPCGSGGAGVLPDGPAAAEAVAEPLLPLPLSLVAANRQL